MKTRYWQRTDLLSPSITLLLCIMGIFMVYSATYNVAQGPSIFFKKQLIGVISGLALYLCFSMLDFRTLYRYGSALYLIVIGLLIFTTIKGTIGMGAQRWLNFGFFKFQPSELTKLFLPAFIVHHLESYTDAPPYRFSHFFFILMTLAISFILIMKQPDLGTALLILFSGIAVLWTAGISSRFFKWSIVVTLLAAPVLWYTLHPYQRKRIEVFLGLGHTQKEAYQIRQSKIAIGSGGVYGKGFLQGTQNKLSFLPEGRTDFVFAVFCEEFGFLGALFLLSCYLVLFLYLLQQILLVPLPHVQLLCFGLLAPIILATIINIGMVIGILPVVGIPLPLLSYGITNLWVTLASLGWINGSILQSTVLFANHSKGSGSSSFF